MFTEQDAAELSALMIVAEIAGYLHALPAPKKAPVERDRTAMRLKAAVTKYTNRLAEVDRHHAAIAAAPDARAASVARYHAITRLSSEPQDRRALVEAQRTLAAYLAREAGTPAT